jgi:hypothetical protein
MEQNPYEAPKEPIEAPPHPASADYWIGVAVLVIAGVVVVWATLGTIDWQ